MSESEVVRFRSEVRANKITRYEKTGQLETVGRQLECHFIEKRDSFVFHIGNQ